MHPALSFHDPWRLVVLALALVTVALRAYFHVRAGTHKEPVVSAREGAGRGLARTVLGFGARILVVVWALFPEALAFADVAKAPGAITTGACALFVARVVGVVVGVLGIALLAWVHATLGRAFSPTLVVRDGAPLVTSGPYARVRHPMYTAFSLLVLGLSLASANVVVAAAGIAAVGFVMVVRTPREERMMADAHGDAWTAYVARTGRFAPRVSQVRAGGGAGAGARAGGGDP